MKVHIVGIAGSGKTTLARSLSERFDIKSFDLDFVVYDSEAGERPAAEITRRIDEIRALDGWVTEGAYRDAWLRPLLDDATAIVWLDVSLPRAMSRMVKRHARAELARNNLHPGWRRLFRFLEYNHKTAGQQRAETMALLAAYPQKVSRCRSSSDVTAFKARIGA
jgi:adenylate kinase family enzyme